jgi:O-methyltransferase involved in polyketide biosynthesis
VADRQQAQLGAVQETLFIPLAARARETRKKRAVLRDPKAVEIAESVEFDAGKYGRGAGGLVVILRTAIFDSWVRSFVAEHPGGTVVEIGTGLNTRFERADNGTIHWIDLDLPDTIELRRKFFTDTERRQMVAASVTGEAWLQTVADSPGPYFFISEGVLVYLNHHPAPGLGAGPAPRRLPLPAAAHRSGDRPDGQAHPFPGGFITARGAASAGNPLLVA